MNSVILSQVVAVAVSQEAKEYVNNPALIVSSVDV